MPSLENMLRPPNGEADGDFMVLDAAIIGAGTSERDWQGGEGAVSFCCESAFSFLPCVDYILVLFALCSITFLYYILSLRLFLTFKL